MRRRRLDRAASKRRLSDVVYRAMLADQKVITRRLTAVVVDR
jgi:hypothetical protein